MSVEVARDSRLANPLEDKERLDTVVDCLKSALSNPSLREQPYRAIQAAVWHHHGKEIASVLSDLRAAEHTVRSRIFEVTSKLVFQLHNVDVTLARAGIVKDDELHPGSALTKHGQSLTALRLDAKERLYLTLKGYSWLREFFYQYPLHFYENSFSFVERIPNKQLPISVAVVGLGIGGSMCASGLAKAGISKVVGYEKRSVTASRSRYQNASWRAYDVARDLLDDEAYGHLLEFRQQLVVTNEEDGTTRTVTADRVQIILGSAITESQKSAERFGADLRFEYSSDTPYDQEADLVVYFAGAHTIPQFNLPVKIHTWPELSSPCDLWLSLVPSVAPDDEEPGNTSSRTGEVGAERWHYTIKSARKTVDDVVRVQNALDLSHKRGKVDSADYEQQSGRIKSVLDHLQKDGDKNRYEYIFTNAPVNPHNRDKRAAATDTVVLDGGYTVDVALATGSTLLPKDKSSGIVIMGGDACVPPNPAAAYGATLACESAAAATQLAVALGHLKAMSDALKDDEASVLSSIEELRELYVAYFEAKSRSENYFQWIQTLICNLYSLPPMGKEN